jgi:hypothetical protein
MMNVGNPDHAFDSARIQNHGIGLARLEFIINRMIGVHPKALLEFDTLDASTRAGVERKMAGYPGPVEFYVSRVAEGVGTIAAAFAPAPVIVRLSDFKSNEYANLIAGRRYEPVEENPMLGFRGASRFVSDAFRDCFELECRALRKVREDMGLDNVWAMIPFVRTPDEGRQVIDVMREFGLEQGRHGLRIIMMCELPSNALLADQFLDMFDGFSGPGFRSHRPPVRRARRGRQDAAGHGHRGLPDAGQVRRHLRPGALRSSGTGPLAGRTGNRKSLAEPRHGRRYLADAGRAVNGRPVRLRATRDGRRAAP